MVLSNKKLKRKLREELGNSLSASETGTDLIIVKSATSDLNPKPQYLKELIDTASHSARLSKREKRRQALNGKGLDRSSNDVSNKIEIESLGDGETGGKSEEPEKKTKKRKREGVKKVESDGEGKEDGVVKETNTKSEKKKKAKKKKKKKKTKKTPMKNEEEKVESEKPSIQETPESTETLPDGIVPRKVYVGGIPYHYTEDEIRSYFKSCGAITEVDCKMRSEDGKFSGIAFVTFEDEDAANQALALDRAAMGDCFLTIQQYTKTNSKRTSGFTPEMVEGYNRVYIGNLSWDATEYDIRKLFSDCVITNIRFGKNKETGEFKGYAHVDFKDGVSVTMALKLDQHIVRGRPVKISCALQKKDENKDENTGSRTDEANYENVYEEETITHYEPVAVIDETYNGGTTSAVSSGKIRRRTCYECGEKGHLSSACPKKQNAETANSNTT